VSWISIYAFFYRALMGLAHRYNWHHVTISGPFEDGTYQVWCQWCGLRHNPRRSVSLFVDGILKEPEDAP
jgi:hypothetical protein